MSPIEGGRVSTSRNGLVWQHQRPGPVLQAKVQDRERETPDFLRLEPPVAFLRFDRPPQTV
jgi:hypothetical protein